MYPLLSRGPAAHGLDPWGKPGPTALSPRTFQASAQLINDDRQVRGNDGPRLSPGRRLSVIYCNSSMDFEPEFSGTRPAAAGAQQPVPNRESQQNGEHADHEKWGNPALRWLRFAADTDHYPRDLIGALRLGAPEAVLVGLENKFSFGVGAPGDYRGFGVARGEYLHLGVGQRLPVLGRELYRHLVRRKQVEGDRRRRCEQKRRCQSKYDDEGEPEHARKIVLSWPGASDKPGNASVRISFFSTLLGHSTFALGTALPAPLRTYTAVPEIDQVASSQLAMNDAALRNISSKG